MVLQMGGATSRRTILNSKTSRGACASSSRCQLAAASVAAPRRGLDRSPGDAFAEATPPRRPLRVRAAGLPRRPVAFDADTRPGPAAGCIHLVEAVPRELDHRCTIALLDAVVDGGSDRDQLHLAQALAIEADVGGHGEVERLPIP